MSGNSGNLFNRDHMHFYKYQGTGNDFILLDNRTTKIVLDQPTIDRLCDRKFGIGADGLMLLENAEGYDFKMVYYNSDGNESTMCGNGGRCMTAFAKQLGVINSAASFLATDGPHTATVHVDETVRLEMNNVSDIKLFEGYAVLNTGSPHYVIWSNDVAGTDVFNEGKRIRNSDTYREQGINVNFAQTVSENKLLVRTYERGVEDETLSCGTGVVASAIASTLLETGKFTIEVDTPGGRLQVSFVKDTPSSATAVLLTGPAKFVFE